MIRTKPLSRHEASLAAVAALDDLVSEILRTCHLKMSPAFLDWVADEATWLVEYRVRQSFDSRHFSASLRRSDHRLAIRRWVGLWIYPGMAVRFQELASYLAEFAHGNVKAVGPPGIPAVSLPRRQRRPAMRWVSQA